jgi:hypothetical protein
VSALTLRLTGQTCRVSCDDPAFLAEIATRYAPFTDPAPPLHPDLEVVVTVRPAPVRVAWEPRFVTHPGVEPLPLPPDYDPARDGPPVPYEVTATPAGLRLAADDKLRAELDEGGRVGRVVQAPNIYIFHTALRQFLAYRLPLGAGCLLHASAVVLDGRAVGFFGVSGSGKSTIARLAPGPVLTDESLGLTRDAGGWTAHTTPFWGDYDPGPPVVGQAPLAALFRLVKAPHDRATRLHPSAAVRELSGSLMYHLAAPAHEAALFRQVAALAAAVPCFTLEFRPTPAVWTTVRAAVASTHP